VLLPFAAGVAWLAARPTQPRAAVWAVVAANLLWVAESLLLPALGWVRPNGLGTAFLLAQALAVLGFALAEAACLRRLRAQAA
jgi:hypothetical protein